MNRREFLTRTLGTAGVLSTGIQARSQTNAQTLRVHINTKHVFGRIPLDFMGLGYEISSVAKPDLLSAANRTYVQLIRTLGAHGVIRVGGNTSDYASFSPAGTAIAAPKGTVINEENLRELGSFLSATGWKLIWGLNLGGGSEQNAVAEAEAVAANIKDRLLAFEIGNEPDLFGHGTAHRPGNYSYADYLKEYRRYKAAIRAKLPGARFAGPDAANATDWVTRFAADEGDDLVLLTHHYYRECAGPGSTLAKLLNPDPKLAPELAILQKAAAASHVPYRICETNSFCGGGKPGVSDTFGAALWVLDFMFTLAWAGAAGVNMETGVNQLGFVSSYSPIGDNEHGQYSATPEYYGMLAFAQGSRGQRLSADWDSTKLNLTIYPVLRDDGSMTITVINKEPHQQANLEISAASGFQHAAALRLKAPSLESKNGVMLGGTAISTNGTWAPTHAESLMTDNGTCRINMPAGSAAVVTLSN